MTPSIKALQRRPSRFYELLFLQHISFGGHTLPAPVAAR